MKTMTHTPAQKKAWHEGKQKSNEDKYAMFRRVYLKKKNARGAATPPQLKRFLRYSSLAERSILK